MRPDLQRQKLERSLAEQPVLSDGPGESAAGDRDRNQTARTPAPENRSDGIDALEDRISRFESGLKSLQGDAQRIKQDIADAHAIARSLARRL